MPEIRQITSALAVAGQLHPNDLAGIAARGFRAIINNRPDDEQTGQPGSSELAAEARRLGLAWRHLPVVTGHISDAEASAFARALEELTGPAVAYCRSGRRSAMLWALTEARRNYADVVLATARAAGHDLELLRPRLKALASDGAR